MLLNTKVLTVAGRACAPLLAVYEPDSSLSSLLFSRASFHCLSELGSQLLAPSKTIVVAGLTSTTSRPENHQNIKFHFSYTVLHQPPPQKMNICDTYGMPIKQPFWAVWPPPPLKVLARGSGTRKVRQLQVRAVVFELYQKVSYRSVALASVQLYDRTKCLHRELHPFRCFSMVMATSPSNWPPPFILVAVISKFPKDNSHRQM